MFATALNVTGVFALSTATTLNETYPPLLEVVIKSELNVITPSEPVTIVLYVVPGSAFTPLICIGILFDTSIRFAVIGKVPPESKTLYVTYWPESNIVLLGVRNIAVGAGLTTMFAEYTEFIVSGVIVLSVTITLATNVPIALVVQTNEFDVRKFETDPLNAIIFDGAPYCDIMKL